MVLRILHIVTYMGRGGLETMIMNYYRHMDRSKVQFDFLVHREFRADYDDEIEQLGGKIYRISRLIPWSKAYRQVLRCFFEEHPEYKIVHVHQDCLSSVALRVAEQQNIPVRIAHSHSSSQDKNWKYLVKLFYKRLIPKYATELFACGKAAGDWMFGGAPYRIVQNAVDVNAYLPNSNVRKAIREKLQIEENCFVVGHVGRFAEPKNHRFLIEVFFELKQRRSNSVLLLIGDGEGRTEIEKLVMQKRLEGSVIFTGVRIDVPDLMQAMDVFVLPSLYEGLPVTMVEAQSAGLPCIISDRVPAECVLVDSVKQISLSVSASEWADQLLKMESFGKNAEPQRISAAGFDIVENAKWLEDYYLIKEKEST